MNNLEGVTSFKIYGYMTLAIKLVPRIGNTGNRRMDRSDAIQAASYDTPLYPRSCNDSIWVLVVFNSRHLVIAFSLIYFFRNTHFGNVISR